NGFFILTKVDADAEARMIIRRIEDFVLKNPQKAALFSSLGTIRFLSAVKHAYAIVGNSSSGIIEAPSLHTATVNIGERQKGRMQSDSVLNCIADAGQIRQRFTEL